MYYWSFYYIWKVHVVTRSFPILSTPSFDFYLPQCTKACSSFLGLNNTFPTVAEERIIWKSVFEISIATVDKCPHMHPTLSAVANATVAQSVIWHYFPEWYNFPVYTRRVAYHVPSIHLRNGRYRPFTYCIDHQRSEIWSANSGKWPNPFRSPIINTI